MQREYRGSGFFAYHAWKGETFCNFSPVIILNKKFK